MNGGEGEPLGRALDLHRGADFARHLANASRAPTVRPAHTSPVQDPGLVEPVRKTFVDAGRPLEKRWAVRTTSR